jgi:Zn-dependent protease
LLDINFAQLFITLLVLLFSLTVHESAHAWAADRLGDPTGRLLGRISLNPLVHIDPIGTVLFPLLATVTHVPVIGWAKPVPVDILRLKNYRRDYLFIALAGPAANLVLAVVSTIGLKIASIGPVQGGQLMVSAPLAQLASRALELNLLLAIFNMIPVPPLDGGSVLAGLLPGHLADQFDRLRPYGFLLLYVLMFTGILSYLVGRPYYLILSWLL